MGLFDLFKFWGRGGKGEEMYIGTLVADMYYKLLAVETCIGFIANTLLACEFQTFECGQEVRKENYYRFNVKPNQNQSAATFWHEVIGRLYRDNEAVVVQHHGNYFIADSFNMTPYVLYENLYSDVQVGDFTFPETFEARDVFHFKLHSKDVSAIFNRVYEDYGKLLTAAQGNYKRKNTPRMIVDIDAAFSPDDLRQKAMRDYLGKQFKAFFEADGAGAIQPMYKSMAINKSINPFASNAIHTTRDIRAIIDDAYDFACMAFHIPAKLIKGDMVGVDALSELYIMGCARPLARILRDEINAKQYTREEALQRTYMKIDTLRIDVTSIAKMSTAADKLYASGVHSVNENRRMIDEEPLPDPWADNHAVTKNYEQLNPPEGGEANANEN